MKKLFVEMIVATLLWTTAQAALIEIPYPDRPDEPQTVTNEFAAKNSRAVVIFLGGGHGQFNWSAYKTISTFPVTVGVINLQDRGISVLIPDWRYEMPIKGGQNYHCAKRCSRDHLERLWGVMLYAQKTYPDQPIWIMGHSNGTISVMEYLKFLHKKKKQLDSLAGAIVSGSRVETRIPVPVRHLAVLHHRQDGCKYTQFSEAERIYRYHQGKLQGRVSLHAIQGGGSGPWATKLGECAGGTHVYEGAEQEMADRVRDIVLENAEK